MATATADVRWTVLAAVWRQRAAHGTADGDRGYIYPRHACLDAARRERSA